MRKYLIAVPSAAAKRGPDFEDCSSAGALNSQREGLVRFREGGCCWAHTRAGGLERRQKSFGRSARTTPELLDLCQLGEAQVPAGV